MKINKKLLFYTLSFCVSSILIVLIFLFNQMNGRDYLVIRSDFEDSIGFYKYFAEQIHEHKSLFFNYTSGLGLNNIMALSGLFSPFNLLYLIFYRFNLDFITAAIIVLKVGFAALSFQIFSTCTLKNNSVSSVFISVFYSLSAYTIEYGTIQIGWMDALIVLPVLCASIIECIEYNKRVNVILLYAYIFIAQYYMGYMIGIFTLLFTSLYLIFLYQRKTDHKIKECLLIFMNWALCVFVAIMLSACIWVPTLFFLAANRVPDSTSIVELSSSLLQILNSLYWGMDYGIEGTYSYIYCGIPALILFPLFFFNSKINIKKKWFYGLLFLILTVSMLSDRLNTIWHVFDQPDDFWYRYSFLLCFCLCAIASIEIFNFEIQEGKRLIYVILGLSVFYQIMLYTRNLWPVDAGIQNTNYGFIINLILMILWSFILFLAYCKNKYRVFCLILAVIVMGYELISGSKRQINYLCDATYNKWLSSVEEVSQDIRNKDKDFYRVIIAQNDEGYNTDTYFGLNGIGDFGNQEKYSVRHFLSNIGFATSPRVTFQNGYNPVSEMILGVKYEINAPLLADVQEKMSESTSISGISNSDKNQTGDSDVTEHLTSSYFSNPYALSVGYLVNGDVLYYDFSGRNVFTNMNELVSAMSGIDENCFITYSSDKAEYDSETIEISKMDNGMMLFSRNANEGEMKILIPKEKYNKAYLQFEVEKPIVSRLDYYIIDAQNASNSIATRMSLSSSNEMKIKDDGDNFIIELVSIDGASPEEVACDNINIAYLDEKVLEKHYNELSKNQLQIKKIDNGHIEGTIHM